MAAFPDYQSKNMRYPRYIDSSQMRKVFRKHSKTAQIEELLGKIRIDIDFNHRYAHWIDTDIWLFSFDKVIGNMPPDYALIIDHSIEELLCSSEKAGNAIGKQNVRLLNVVERYIDRILDHIGGTPGEQAEKFRKYFSRMKTDKAESLEEAFQRILFWSSLMWQSGHRLVGLGRLDLILSRFEDQCDEACIEDFILELHRYYSFKSTALLGDIGQIIIVGGLDKSQTYFCNRLTYAFINAVCKLQIPDPKVLLRICSKTPEDLITIAVRSIATGVGSPLLANDERIIPSLSEFGYSDDDAYNYVTSACWEPLSYGNSLEQNNIGNINFAEALYQTIVDEKFLNCSTYEELEDLYCAHLTLITRKITDKILQIIWEPDPLFTLFTKGCLENNKDISDGGAENNNYGLLSVGLANAVDSLVNLKKKIYEEQEYSLSLIHRSWENGDEKYEEIRQILGDQAHSFGHDEEYILKIANRLINTVSRTLEPVRNKFGGRIKFGLSSPGYVVEGEKAGPTFDGRTKGAPTAVHISAQDGVAYTELCSFAAQLNYSGICSNGNVIDFMVSRNLISDNEEAFKKFVIAAIKSGFFEMQMNVLDSGKLKEAKKDPEKYPGLIVRVWGFSAYFKDLPEEYQNVLIKRAEESEKA